MNPPSMLYGRLTDSEDIRLLTILPGNSHPIHVKLSVAFLSRAESRIPAYKALSYVWGASHPRKSVICDGEPITVTANLEAALLQIRHESQAQVVWIDQLCINQDDLEERSQQVAIMGLIYRNAEEVIIWTGEANEDTGIVWNLLLEIRKLASFKGEEVFNLALEDRSIQGSDKSEAIDVITQVQVLSQELNTGKKQLPSLPSGKDPRWQLVKQFLQRPWFSRVWTFQEAVMGHKCIVYCGNLYLSWSLLQDACVGMDIAGYARAAEMEIQSHNVTFVTSQRQRFTKGIHFALRTLLEANRTREATEARDMVYALRGVIDPRLAPSLQIDYKTPLGIIFARAAKFCIESEKALTVLGSVEYRRTEESRIEMPSWVPDWRFKTSVHVDLSMRRFDNSKYFNVSKDKMPLLLPGPDERKLVIKGFVVATITSFCNVKSDLGLQAHLSSDRFGAERFDIEGWSAMFRTASSKVPLTASTTAGSEQADFIMASIWAKSITKPLTDEEGREMAFRRTVTADLFPRPNCRLNQSEIVIQFAAYEAWQNGGFRSPVPAEVLHEHDFYVAKVMSNREFFVARRGSESYMGIVMGVPKEGDMVCVLLGGDTPFVLRPLGNEEWHFVAEAYVHGIMDGEAMEKVANDGSDFQEFSIG